MDITPPLIAGLAAIVLSVLVERVPGFATWFQPLDSERKRLVMSILLILTAIGAVVWSCWPTETVTFSHCLSTTNWKTIVATLFATLVNQPAHQLLRKEDEGEKEEKEENAG